MGSREKKKGILSLTCGVCFGHDFTEGIVFFCVVLSLTYPSMTNYCFCTPFLKKKDQCSVHLFQRKNLLLVVFFMSFCSLTKIPSGAAHLVVTYDALASALKTRKALDASTKIYNKWDKPDVMVKRIYRMIQKADARMLTQLESIGLGNAWKEKLKCKHPGKVLYTSLSLSLSRSLSLSLSLALSLSLTLTHTLSHTHTNKL